MVAASSSGLGRASALALAREGVKVAVNSRDKARAERTAAEIRAETGATVIAVAADVATAEGAATLVETAARELGGLHILIANAGGPPTGRFEELDEAKWAAAFELNLLSAVRLARAATPHMKAAGWGRIICIASVSAKMPLENLMLSNALRAGVVGFAKTLAGELGPHGICVNVVCPGSILTPRVEALQRDQARRLGQSEDEVAKRSAGQVPVGRLGRPEELGDVVCFLASARASFLNGVTLQVDGGLCKSLL